MIHRVTGHPIEEQTCPWRGYYDPMVSAVVRAYDFFSKGQAAEWWGSDPEWWIVEGVGIYHRALEQTQADAIETRRRQS